MTWEAIGEPKLDAATPGELSLLAPTDAWPHVVGGAAGNGRAASPLGYARTTRWVCELPEGPPVMRLLVLGEQTVAIRVPDGEGRQRVALIDGEGRHRADVDGRRGDWAIDSRFAKLLGRTSDAELGAWSLAEPERAPILVFNRVNQRELDALRRCDAVWVALTRQAKTLGGPPPDVLVDVLAIPHYDDVSRWRSLRSRTRVAERIAEAIDRVVLGFDPAGVILAHAHELWWGDWTLRERARLELGPDALPLQIAPRSDGSSWLLIERAGQLELWQIVVGRCVQTIVLSPALVDATLLVAPDDAVVLVSSSDVARFDAEGRPTWAFPRMGPALGLIDDRGVALYSDGGALICIDPQGVRAMVWAAPEGVVRLGPLAATAAGVWVGAGRSVYAV